MRTQKFSEIKTNTFMNCWNLCERRVKMVFRFVDSAHQLMRSVVRATTRSSTRAGSRGGVAPERLFDSPNRITRLIRNRREKLMRLAAIEAGAQVVNLTSNSANNDGESEPQEREVGSEEENDDQVLAEKFKSKSKSRTKGLKRKQGAASGRRCRTRRKCAVLNLEIPSDSESETEQRNMMNTTISSESESDLFLADATQPSTSSGLISSRRSRYPATPLTVDTDHGESSKSSENEAGVSIKRKKGPNDRENSTRRIYRRQQCKSRNRRSAISSEEQRINGHLQANQIDQVANGDHLAEERKACTATPPKRLSSNKVTPPTPDSGITSGLSTLEKCERNGSAGARNAAETSDHETRVKNLESFKKKIDVARRGYRKRLTPHAKIAASTASDSSD